MVWPFFSSIYEKKKQQKSLSLDTYIYIYIFVFICIFVVDNMFAVLWGELWSTVFEVLNIGMNSWKYITLYF